jgi:hypothetical protein
VIKPEECSLINNYLIQTPGKKYKSLYKYAGNEE